MSRQMSDDPVDRIGVYKRLADVPARYRLEHHADEYVDRDVWAEFIDHKREVHGRDSELYHERAERVDRYWRKHLEDRGRHPALATPEDVETFFADMLELGSPSTAYRPYWTRLEAFFDYLLWHTDHPHRYHPVLMAVVEYPDGAAARVWGEKLEQRGGGN